MQQSSYTDSIGRLCSFSDEESNVRSITTPHGIFAMIRVWTTFEKMKKSSPSQIIEAFLI
ncbi:hypothetical protein [Sicyoidochytrium minutum DNA virus]|nr:hypothetical protein [Sicyoidochytrium minutum DNA virus]